MNSKNISIIFNEQADEALFRILDKYNLRESEEEIFRKLAEGENSNEIIIDSLTKELLQEKISNTEFLSTLQKKLNLSKEIIKNLSLDILHNLIPLLDIVPDDQLDTYNTKKDSKKPLQSDVLRREEVGEPIQKTKEIIPPAPQQSPEKPVEKMEEPKKVKTVLPPEAAKPNPTDTYREPIE